MNSLLRENELKTKNKKRASNDVASLPALQSLKNVDVVVIRSIAIHLGFVEAFFMRGHNNAKSRACQFS